MSGAIGRNSTSYGSDTWQQHFDDWGFTDGRHDGAVRCREVSNRADAFGPTDIRDGTSKTIRVGERCRNPNNGSTRYAYFATNSPNDNDARFC